MKLVKLTLTTNQLKRLIAIELEQVAHLEAKLAVATRGDSTFAAISRQLYQSKADLEYLNSFLNRQADGQ